MHATVRSIGAALISAVKHSGILWRLMWMVGEDECDGAGTDEEALKLWHCRQQTELMEDKHHYLLIT